MDMITCRDVSYRYDSAGRAAVSGVSLDVKKGELVALLGRNGSGKSTLIRHFNALLSLQEGELIVGGIDASGKKNIWDLRRLSGMVFQNPDNQFVAPVVFDDVAFGLENYLVPREEIPTRVEKALDAVGMKGFENRAPHTLSGGQKQRVALAGVLAVEPDIVIFDEATSMLDPRGRSEVLSIIRQLHESGKTIIMITHYIEECVSADRVILMDSGKGVCSGAPENVLTDRERLKSAGMMPPMPVRVYYDLLERGVQLDRCPLTEEELTELLCR